MDDKSAEDKLLRLINFGLSGGLIVAMLAVGSYVWYFGVHLHTGLSGDPVAWGAFGDFLGGILNPAVAFFAFILLAKSVQIQNKELRATSTALKEASAAQGEQVAVQKAAATMSALATLISSVDQEIETKSRLHSRVDEAIGSANMVWYEGEHRAGTQLEHIEEQLRIELQNLEIQRNNFIGGLNDVRDEMNGHAAPPLALE